MEDLIQQLVNKARLEYVTSNPESPHPPTITELSKKHSVPIATLKSARDSQNWDLHRSQFIVKHSRDLAIQTEQVIQKHSHDLSALAAELLEKKIHTVRRFSDIIDTQLTRILENPDSEELSLRSIIDLQRIVSKDTSDLLKVIFEFTKVEQERKRIESGEYGGVSGDALLEEIQSKLRIYSELAGFISDSETIEIPDQDKKFVFENLDERKTD